MSKALRIVSLDLAASLDVNKKNFVVGVLSELHMRDYWVCTPKPEQHLVHPRLRVVHVNLALLPLSVLKIDQSLTIEIKGHSLLRKSESFRRVRDQLTLL